MASKDIKDRIQLALPMWAIDLVSSARLILGIVPNYAYDIGRFLRYSASIAPNATRAKLESLLIKDYHRLEKGMALPNPRSDFGKLVIRRIMERLPKYACGFGWDAHCSTVVNVVRSYIEFRAARGEPTTEIEEWLGAMEGLSSTSGQHTDGGILMVDSSALARATSIDFDGFAKARHSVRCFTGRKLDDQVIRDAVETARYSPSVCNRQSWKVHSYATPEEIEQLLEYQNGNRGFGQLISHLLVVSSDLRTFEGVGERNQCYVDGGLFCMLLALALHAQGVGTCFLNWSVTGRTDRKFKRAASIEGNETIVTLMAVGEFPTRFPVAQSPRRPTEEILVTR